MTQTYNAEDIKVLSDLEGVRTRPHMYVGTVENPNHLFTEIFDNSVDEYLAGYCNKIFVILEKSKETITIKDNGRGIPIDMHKEEKRYAPEVIFTKLHSGGKFNTKAYSESGGLNGLGSTCVNFLSEKFTVDIIRDDSRYTQEFKKGVPTQPIIEKYNSKETGTSITFTPDRTIYASIEFDPKWLKEKCEYCSYLNKNLTIEFFDESTGEHYVFADSGIDKLLEKIYDKEEYCLKETVHIDEDNVKIAFQYTKEDGEKWTSYANNIYTNEGGYHVNGFRIGYLKVLKECFESNKLKTDSFLPSDYREGLIFIVSIKFSNAHYEGQTKNKLVSIEAETIVGNFVQDQLTNYFNKHDFILKSIYEKIKENEKVRTAVKKAKELSRQVANVSKKDDLLGLRSSGKLTDCTSRDLELNEVWLVEGESAGGCWSKNTKIKLADQRDITFFDLVEEHKQGKENFCYSIDKNGEICIEKIENPRMTKRMTQVIKITLNNNEELICTPDHLYMLRNGEYKQAKDLLTTDSLMPLFTMFVNGYEQDHKILKIEYLQERMDVYDLEVPRTHNFALSAGIFVHNSAKDARERTTQAVYPLRGKVLNVAKTDLNSALSNEEISGLLKAMGCGMLDNYNDRKLRYGKIVIATDADTDGLHIQALLLGMFYKLVPKLIENGRVYISHPPLFKVVKGTKISYVDKVDHANSQGAIVTRFKGLGEMNSEELEIVMNSKTRKLTQITMSNLEQISKDMEMCVGNDLASRKEMILNLYKEGGKDEIIR